MKQSTTFALGISFGAFVGVAQVLAGPLDASRHTHPDSLHAVHEAEHDVDHAWEVYHRAALGGTVASPAVQADIEQHLHEARTLITQAQEAADRGDKRQVDRLVEQIKVHTTEAIQGSKEQKK